MAILIVEDDKYERGRIRRCLKGHFDLAEYDAETAQDAMEITQGEDITAAIIDLQLKGDSAGEISGLELFRRLRELTRKQGLPYRLPIMVLTYYGETRRRLESYEAGCDRFVAKPFDCNELRAELRVMIESSAREAGRSIEDVLEHGPIVMNVGMGVVKIQGEAVDLPDQPYKILKRLMQAKGRVVKTDDMLLELWPDQDKLGSDLHPIISQLRGKLFPDYRKLKFDPIPYRGNEGGYRVAGVDEIPERYQK